MPYKTCFLQYKWNYVNNKGICVKRLFSSLVLDYNWRLDLVISDHQQCTPQAVPDGGGEGYDHHYRQLTAEAKIGLRCGLRCGYERCECIVVFIPFFHQTRTISVGSFFKFPSYDSSYDEGEVQQHSSSKEASREYMDPDLIPDKSSNIEEEEEEDTEEEDEEEEEDDDDNEPEDDDVDE